MLCIAHRGARGHAPENTIAAIEKALELGARSVEVDVYFVDGQLVVFHDDRLERTTNGSGYLLDQTFCDLRKLDAGCGEVIPTLAEVLDTLNQRAAINIELKGPGTVEPVLEAVAHYRSNAGWSNDLFLISSFNHRELVKVRSLDKQVKIGALTVSLPVTNAEFASQLTSYSVHLSIEFIDSQFIHDAKSRGMRVFVFTVNHPEDIVKMHDLQIDGVFTDYPDRVLSTLSEQDQPMGWL